MHLETACLYIRTYVLLYIFDAAHMCNITCMNINHSVYVSVSPSEDVVCVF